jgi:hypothetical protein
MNAPKAPEHAQHLVGRVVAKAFVDAVTGELREFQGKVVEISDEWLDESGRTHKLPEGELIYHIWCALLGPF